MVTLNDSALTDELRSLRDHGASRSDLERHENLGAFQLADYDRLGYNYRMTDIQGAIGSIQMDRLAWVLERRTEIARNYDDALASFHWLAPPAVPAESTHGYQSYVCLFRPEEPTLGNVDALSDRRNKLMSKLEEVGISTRPGTHAAALQGYYKARYGYTPQDFPNAYMADRLSLSLPLYPQMTDRDQDRVLDALERAGSEVA